MEETDGSPAPMAEPVNERPRRNKRKSSVSDIDASPERNSKRSGRSYQTLLLFFFINIIPMLALLWSAYPFAKIFLSLQLCELYFDLVIKRIS